MLLQTSWLSNNKGQNQAHGEEYRSVSEIPPPSKTSQGKRNMKNKVECNYVTHKQEEPRISAAAPTFSSLPAPLSEMAPLWKAPGQMSGSTKTSQSLPHIILTKQPGLKGQNKEIA